MQSKQMTRSLGLVAFMDGLVFFAPVALLVRTTAGLTVRDFFLLQALLSFVNVFTELPAGRFTDRYGYKATFLLYQILLLAARLLLFAAFLCRSAPLFVVEAAVEGLSWSLSTGTRSAYLYTMLPREDYVTASARVSNYGTAGFFVCTLVYAALYTAAGLEGLLAATCASHAAAVLIAARLPKDTPQPTPTAQTSKTKLLTLLRTPKTLALVAMLSAVGLGRSLINFFYADKLLACGLSELWMTPVILGYSAVELLAERILARAGYARHRTLAAVFFALSGAGFILLGVADQKAAVLALMLLLPLLLDVPSYLLDEWQNEYIDAAGQKKKRAELLNLFSMGVAAVDIFFLLGSSLVSAAGSAVCFFALGSFFILAGTFIGKKKAE